MEQIFTSLREILVLALPAFFLVLLLHFYLKKVLFLPMERVLDERRRLTEGAVAGSEEAVRAAEEKMRDYENRLAEARAAIYQDNEVARKRLADQQSAALADARAASAALVAEARTAIAEESAAARASLAADAGQLAIRISDTILAGKVN
jgi:F-type H+-transporting ATPase subunit b